MTLIGAILRVFPPRFRVPAITHPGGGGHASFALTARGMLDD